MKTNSPPEKSNFLWAHNTSNSGNTSAVSGCVTPFCSNDSKNMVWIWLRFDPASLKYRWETSAFLFKWVIDIIIQLVVLDTLSQSRQALMISCLTTEQPQLFVYTIQAYEDIDCLSPCGTKARSLHLAWEQGKETYCKTSAVTLVLLTGWSHMLYMFMFVAFFN